MHNSLLTSCTDSSSSTHLQCLSFRSISSFSSESFRSWSPSSVHTRCATQTTNSGTGHLTLQCHGVENIQVYLVYHCTRSTPGLVRLGVPFQSLLLCPWKVYGWHTNLWSSELAIKVWCWQQGVPQICFPPAHKLICILLGREPKIDSEWLLGDGVFSLCCVLISWCLI